MMEYWIRARAFQVGEHWRLLDTGGLRAEMPPEPVLRVVAGLAHESPGVALARVGHGRWCVASAGHRSGQRLSNTPYPTAVIVAVGDERSCRGLAARFVEDVASSTGLGVRLAGYVLDGPDTETFALHPGLVELLRPATTARGLGSPTLPSGVRRLGAASTRELADALLGAAPLPDTEVVVIVSVRPLPVFTPSVPSYVALVGEPEATAAAPAPDRGFTDVPPAPSTPQRLLGRVARQRGRIIGRVVDLIAAAGLALTVGALAVAVQAVLQIAERLRTALGFTAPSGGVDAYIVVVCVLLGGTAVALVIGLGRVIRHRFGARAAAILGPGATPIWTRRLRSGPQRRRWLQDLLASPGWEPKVVAWRAEGTLPAVLSDDAAYRAAATLVAGELRQRLGERALATGLAVAVVRNPIADAAATVAGSAEIQIDALATLGLRPTLAGWWRLVRTASTALVAATYLDVEDRLELELAVRAAVLGLNSTADAIAAAGDALEDDLADLLGESLDGMGGAASAAVAAVTGASLGVTSSGVRQLAAFTDEIGAQVVEGLVVSSLLLHHGMSVTADALGLDAEHHASLLPSAGRVPGELLDVGVQLARRQRIQLRDLLRRRARALPTTLARRARRQGKRGSVADVPT